MTKTILDTKKIDHGICLIDIYREAGDLYDSWDIVAQKKMALSLEILMLAMGAVIVTHQTGLLNQFT